MEKGREDSSKELIHLIYHPCTVGWMTDLLMEHLLSERNTPHIHILSSLSLDSMGQWPSDDLQGRTVAPMMNASLQIFGIKRGRLSRVWFTFTLSCLCASGSRCITEEPAYPISTIVVLVRPAQCFPA